MDQCRHTLEQHNWNIEAAVQDRLNEQEGVPSVFNPPPSRPLQVNTADHRIYSYVVSRPQPRALNDAKRELRFLLVYLHGDDHQDSDEFCRNTLFSQALRENTYPFLAMIMLKDRRMTVVGRLEGLIQPDDLINQLTFIMDANQTYLVSERLEREERNQTQVLRQQQDEAYLASLRADQEKERKKREERERKRRKEEEVQQQKLAEERRRQNLQEEKERKLECLPPEPSADDPESVK
uniref:Fas associated factor family member 2 n=1 Tax=Cavia porcellus TaxID=10141 RepID=A0A286XFH2_CAVPO